MVSVNRITVIGNLGGDPEMRFTPNGHAVTTFNVATNRRYTTADGERRDDTEWFTIVSWNKLAEQCNQYLTKGRLVYVEGRVKLTSWDGQDGQRRSRMEINADRVNFLDKGGAGGTGEGGAGPTGEGRAEPPEEGDFAPDDIPF
jgi:single-strand DNA-binding protein